MIQLICNEANTLRKSFLFNFYYSKHTPLLFFLKNKYKCVIIILVKRVGYIYMIVNENWNYNDVVVNIEALKYKYKDILASFSWLKLKDKNKFIYDFKRQIYNLKMREYEQNMIWEYLNDDRQLEEVFSLMR